MCQFYHDKFDFLEFSQRNRGRIRYDNRDRVGRSDRRGAGTGGLPMRLACTIDKNSLIQQMFVNLQIGP